MKTVRNFTNNIPDSAGFLAVFLILAICGAVLSAVAVVNALSGQLVDAAPGACGVAAVAVGHWWSKREGHYSVVPVVLLFGAAVGVVGGVGVHLVRVVF